MMKRILALFMTICLLLGTASCSPSPEEVRMREEAGKVFRTDSQSREVDLLGLIEAYGGRELREPFICVERFDVEFTRDFELKVVSLCYSVYDQEKTYQNSYSISYGYGNDWTHTDQGKGPLPCFYNENLELTYVSEKLKEIPLKQQVEKLGKKNYRISFDGIVRLNPEHFEERCFFLDEEEKGYPVCSSQEVKTGAKSVTEEEFVGARLLGDSTGSDIQRIWYRFLPADRESLIANQSALMQYDYRAEEDSLSFTRDYGKNWIPAEVTKEEISDTMEFLRGGLGNLLPEGSYSISSNEDGVIAFFITGQPSLRISRDGGNTWDTHTFPREPMPAPSNRFVHFFDDKTGFVALGTEWSMGVGQDFSLWFTRDGGVSWEESGLP